MRVRRDDRVEVMLAESAGFCYGVSRALNTVLGAAKSRERPMFTLGPLIHNPQVIEKLEGDGVKSISEVGLIPAGSIAVMPSHGVSESVLKQAMAAGLEIIDVTCPYVAKVHRIAGSLARQGYQVIILGDQGHTEVRGILSMSGEDALVVSDACEIGQYSLKKRVGLVAQTTQTIERYQALVAEVSSRAYEVRAYNTICNATSDRQKAALKIAKGVDVMLVVGGRNSANTRRLAEICAETGVPTHHVEVADEIVPEWFVGANRVGVTAGASTPDWIIDDVVRNVRGM
jgi:small subunit ribosomal protein S1